jgi:V/A-type H+/Na+-transporting ATPase subunit E
VEVQLQELLERIRREGVDAARTEADGITADARGRAKAIVAEAEREARLIVERARAEAVRAEQSGRAALAQASRDLLLSFRESLQAVLDAVTAAETRAALSPQAVAAALPSVLGALAQAGVEDPVVLLPQSAVAEVERRLMAGLSERLRAGVVLRPSPDLDAGFRIQERDGSAYYDFSAATVAELLGRRLNERLAGICRDAAREP